MSAQHMKVLANGIAIHCEISGTADGATVAMSHSLGSSGIMWEPQLQELERNYRVLRIDTRGHGNTSAPVGPYSLDQLIDDATAVLDDLELDSVHWVGLSMGGMIGQGLALKAPNRLRSLALCNTMSVIREEAKSAWRQRISTGEQFGMNSLADFAMERWFTESYRQSGAMRYRQIRDQFIRTSLDGYLGCCHAIYKMDYIDELSRIQIPTHIIAGAQDLATPVSESIAMHDRISGSTLEIIPGAAHLSNVEQAQIFNTSLTAFLDRI